LARTLFSVTKMHGALVSKVDGTTQPIEEIRVGDRVLGWSGMEQKVAPAFVTQRTKRAQHTTAEITLEDGRVVECPADQLCQMQDGSLVEAQHLMNQDQRVLMTVAYPQLILSSPEDLSWSLKLGDLCELNLVENKFKAMAFARLCGFVLSDGTVSDQYGCGAAMQVYAGTDVGKELLLDDIELLCGSRPNVGENVPRFGLSVRLARAIWATDPVAFEPGNRINKPYVLPTWVTADECPRLIQAEFLAGLFGGDGVTACLSQSKGSRRMTSIGFVASKTPEHLASLYSGFNILIKMLSNFGIESRIVGEDVRNEGGSVKLKLECNGGVETIKFEEQIGFRYDAHKQIRLTVAAAYYRMREACSEYNSEFINTARQIYAASDLTWPQSRELTIARFATEGRVQIGPTSRCAPSVKALREPRTPSKRGLKMPNGDYLENWIASVGAADLFRARDADPLSISHGVKVKDKGLPTFAFKVVQVKIVEKEEYADFDLCTDLGSFVLNGMLVANRKEGDEEESERKRICV
jgi:LAGLIDADG-like domain